MSTCKPDAADAAAFFAAIRRDWGASGSAAKRLANACNTEVKTAENWLQGRRIPSYRSLVALCGASEAAREELLRQIDLSKQQRMRDARTGVSTAKADDANG